MLNYLVLYAPAVLGTNNSGPLSPTSAGVPDCTEPPVALGTVIGLSTGVGTLGPNIPVIPFVLLHLLYLKLTLVLLFFEYLLINLLKYF